MKTLFTTTAMVVAMGLPFAVLAQTTATPPAAPAETAPVAPAEAVPAAPAETVPAAAADADATAGFLAVRGASDLFASELMGHEVYARKIPIDATTGTTADTDTGMANMTQADLDGMDNIGQITDIILSGDGSVTAFVIGVGGFIGVGEQDVAVTMDQVTFAVDADNPDEMYIVVNTSGEMFMTSPAFDRMGTADGMGAADGAAAPAATAATGEPAVAGGATDRERLTAPTMARDGYNQVAVTEVSIEQLIGKSVFGVDDSDVGSIQDVIADEAGAIQTVVIDFGGFLGMGSTQIALDFAELTILSTEGFADIRVYVDATKEQIQAMPVYTPAN